MNVFKPGWVNPRKHEHTWSPHEIPILYPPIRSQADTENAAGIPKHFQNEMFELLEAVMREDGVSPRGKPSTPLADEKMMKRVNEAMQSVVESLDELDDSQFQALDVPLQAAAQLTIDLLHSGDPEPLLSTAADKVFDEKLRGMIHLNLDAFLALRNVQDSRLEKLSLAALKASPFPEMALFERSVKFRSVGDPTTLVISGKLFRSLKSLLGEELNPIEMLDAVDAAPLVSKMSQILSDMDS